MKEKTSREEHAEARREQIIQAALKVFSEKGFLAATNKDIAAAAGIAPGLIYHYFKDRQDLLANVVGRINPALQLVRSRREQPADIPLGEALLEFAQEFVKFMGNDSNTALMKVILGELVRDSQAAEAFYKSVPQEVISYMSELLQKHLPPDCQARQHLRQTVISFLGPLLSTALFKVVFHVNNQPFDASLHVDCFLASLKLG